MAKTVTAMLIGIAIAEGRIRSVDDLADLRARAGRHRVRTHVAPALAADVLRCSLHRGVPRAATMSLGSSTTRSMRVARRRGGGDAVQRPRASERDPVLLRLRRDPGARPRAVARGRAPGRRVPAGEDLAADRGRGRRDLARRPLGPGGHVLLPQRGPARLRAARPAAGPRRQLARSADHPAAWVREATTVRPDQPHVRPGTATPFFGYGYQTWIFPASADVRAPRRARPGDLRRSGEPARHGPHRRPQAPVDRPPRPSPSGEASCATSGRVASSRASPPLVELRALHRPPRRRLPRRAARRWSAWYP